MILGQAVIRMLPFGKAPAGWAFILDTVNDPAVFGSD
jgi:hypothetical protein